MLAPLKSDHLPLRPVRHVDHRIAARLHRPRGDPPAHTQLPGDTQPLA